MPKRVLIADDMVFFRTALKEILSGEGFELVGEAKNGEEAVKMAKALKPDIVMLDIIMPVKNGIEAARELVKLGLQMKIVMCTSLGYEAVVEEAIRSGACAFIIKPFKESDVLDVLNGIKT